MEERIKAKKENNEWKKEEWKQERRMNLKKVDVNRKNEWRNNISEWVNERMKNLEEKSLKTLIQGKMTNERQ